MLRVSGSDDGRQKSESTVTMLRKSVGLVLQKR